MLNLDLKRYENFAIICQYLILKNHISFIKLEIKLKFPNRRSKINPKRLISEINFERRYNSNIELPFPTYEILIKL